MAYEKLRTTFITAVPKTRSARLPKPTQLPENAHGGRYCEWRFEPIIFAPSIRELFRVVVDEHFMFATVAREVGRPNRAPASG